MMSRTIVPRLDLEVERRSGGHGEVITRKMTPEEMERYKNLGPVRDSNGKIMRKPAGIIVSNFDKAEEIKRKNSDGGKAMSEQRKSKYEHVTKEFLESEIAKGKSAAQIERELDMPKGGIYNLTKKYDIKIPRVRAKKVDKSVDLVPDFEKEILNLKQELEKAQALNDSLTEMQKISDEETHRLIGEIKRLTKELEMAKDHADTQTTEQIGKVSQVQEGNHIVIKIPLGRVVGE